MSRKFVAILLLCLCFATFASADTLKLTNGQIIYGVFMGRANDAIQFLGPDGTTKSYPTAQVAGLTFGPIPSAAQQAAAATPPPPMEINVPSGTFILVRMSEALDTSTAQKGQIFTATLATNLAAQGYIVARQGTTVYGQVTDVSSARRLFGKSKITLQLHANRDQRNCSRNHHRYLLFRWQEFLRPYPPVELSAALGSARALARWPGMLVKVPPSALSRAYFFPRCSAVIKCRFPPRLRWTSLWNNLSLCPYLRSAAQRGSNYTQYSLWRRL